MPSFTQPRRHRATRPLTLLALTGGLLLVACGDDDDTATATDGTTTTAADDATTTTQAPAPEVPITDIDVTAGGAGAEYSFATDLTTVEAGRVRVNLTNEGAEEHQAMLVRMPEGVDLGALATAAPPIRRAPRRSTWSRATAARTRLPRAVAPRARPRTSTLATT